MFLIVPLAESWVCNVRGIKGINALDRPVERLENIPLPEMVKGLLWHNADLSPPENMLPLQKHILPYITIYRLTFFAFQPFFVLESHISLGDVA